MTTHDDDEMLILNEIERRVGSLADSQRRETVEAIRQDDAGTLALAKRVADNPAVKSAPGVFMASIRRGEHRHLTAVASTPDATPQQQRTPAEKARGLYRVKLTELDRRASHWSLVQRHEFALDYALDHCGQPGLRPSEVIAGVQTPIPDDEDIPW